MLSVDCLAPTVHVLKALALSYTVSNHISLAFILLQTPDYSEGIVRLYTPTTQKTTPVDNVCCFSK